MNKKNWLGLIWFEVQILLGSKIWNKKKLAEHPWESSKISRINWMTIKIKNNLFYGGGNVEWKIDRETIGNLYVNLLPYPSGLVILSHPCSRNNRRSKWRSTSRMRAEYRGPLKVNCYVCGWPRDLFLRPNLSHGELYTSEKMYICI